MAQNYAAGHACSALYVFSTQLANRAAQAVSCHQFSSIIEFHRSQQETRRLLALSPSSTKSIIKAVGQECKKRSMSASTMPSSSDGGPPLLDGGDAAPVKEESIAGKNDSTGGSQERDLSADGQSDRNDEQDSSNKADNPLEKMARLTQEALPFEPPAKQGKLSSPRDRAKSTTDDQLTPAQRQHRQEALQRIEDLKNFFGMSQQQQSVMAMNAAAAAAAAAAGQQPPAPFPQPYCTEDGKQPNMVNPNAENGSQPNAMMVARSEQQLVEAQFQWQQLVAEHEAKKQMHQNVLPPAASPMPTDAAFLRPGTRMMVQGKPAVMVPPVASPRNPQRARAPRNAPPPDVYAEAAGNPPAPPHHAYDVGMRQPMHFGMARPIGPRFLPAPSFRGAPPGQELSNAIDNGAYVSDDGFIDSCGYVRTGPSYGPYAVQQHQPEMGEYGAAGNLKMAPQAHSQPGQIQMGSNMSAQKQQQHQQPFVAQCYEFDTQGNGGNIPMVNNTYVNATMSIQQVNIQNVSPYPGGGMISMPGRPAPNQTYLAPPPPQNNYARMLGPAPLPPPPRSAQPGCFPQAAAVRHGQPTQASNMRPAAYMNSEGGICYATMEAGSSGGGGGFFADFAEPLTNLDSKVPSQKLQYFPNPIQQQHQFQAAEASDVANYHSMTAGPQTVTFIPQQVYAGGPTTVVHGHSSPAPQTPAPIGAQQQQQQQNAMSSAGQRAQTGVAMVNRMPTASDAYAAPPTVAANGNGRESTAAAYRAQFQNFQQQLYATSVRRPESNSA